MIKFTIGINVLRAVEMFAADKDVRFYLVGTYVRVIDADTLSLVATDGAVLGEYRHVRDAATDEPYPVGRSAIVPAGYLKGLKAHKSQPFVSMAVGSEEWEVNYLGDKRSGRCVDGRFPDTDQVWPNKKQAVSPGHYNIQLLDRIADAARLVGVKHPHLIQNGPSDTAVWVINTQFAGVLMPMRMDSVSIPAWCPLKPCLSG